jgi:hypothetical protein
MNINAVALISEINLCHTKILVTVSAVAWCMSCSTYFTLIIVHQTELAKFQLCSSGRCLDFFLFFFVFHFFLYLFHFWYCTQILERDEPPWAMETTVSKQQKHISKQTTNPMSQKWILILSMNCDMTSMLTWIYI